MFEFILIVSMVFIFLIISPKFLYMRKLKKNDLALYKFVKKMEDAIMICIPCTSPQLHERLVPTGTVTHMPNMKCMVCGNKQHAKYDGKCI